MFLFFQLKEEIVQKEHEIKQMTVKTRYLEEGINAKNITLDQEIQRQRELKALITKMKSDIYDVHEKMKDLNPDELKAATQVWKFNLNTILNLRICQVTC